MKEGENVNINVVFVGALVAIAAAYVGLVLYDILSQPRKDDQISKAREWLLYAVTTAEKLYGSGTGKIKLRYTYDRFIAQFPALTDWISFDEFSEMVDQALVDMRKMLKDNEAVRELVEGGAKKEA